MVLSIVQHHQKIYSWEQKFKNNLKLIKNNMSTLKGGENSNKEIEAFKEYLHDGRFFWGTKMLHDSAREFYWQSSSSKQRKISRKRLRFH